MDIMSNYESEETEVSETDRQTQERVPAPFGFFQNPEQEG